MVAKDLQAIIVDTLQLSPDTQFDSNTPLLGHIAELDSMAIVALLTAIEEDLGIEVYDDEINADVFETFGSLVSFVEGKI